VKRLLPFLYLVLPPALTPALAPCAELNFRIQEFETRLGVGYAVRIVDMNEDRRPDIVVVDTERVVWYENPAWKQHTLIQNQTKKDNVCIAPYDIDGDGKVDFALGADWRPFDTKTGGTIQWLRRGDSPGDLWKVHPIGEEPTTHRMQWVDLDGDGRSELVVVPLMGRGTTRPKFDEAPIRILAYKIPADPVKGPWVPEVINQELYVAHNFTPTDLDRDGRTDLLIASFEGVTLLRRSPEGKWTSAHIGQGNQNNQRTPPNRGASEIKHGRLAGGEDYIATIEPWHGFEVVVYTRPAGEKGPAIGEKPQLWTRSVLDDQLTWGHAVWCANLDDDEDQELVIGVRDDFRDNDKFMACGVRIYDPRRESGKLLWTTHYIDLGGVAVEDLAADDLDGDSRIDLVAVGRKTKNGRIYWNQGR
jgi:hypothetical protein